MATLEFQQTDTAAGCTLPSSGTTYCTGLNGSSNIRFDRTASVGGSAGSGSLAYTDLLASDTLAIPRLLFELIPGSGSSAWNAGTWTVRVEVTSGNMNARLQHVWICRVNSSCVNQETLGSSTDLDMTLNPAGVFQVEVSGAAATSPAGTDRLLIILGMNATMANTAVTLLPSQIITFDDGGGAPGFQPAWAHRAVPVIGSGVY